MRNARIKVEAHFVNVQEVLKKVDHSQEIVASRVASAFGAVAMNGAVVGFNELNRGLTIRSRNYIRTANKAMPVTPGQHRGFAYGFTKRGVAEGVVYIRGAVNPKNSMDFLLNHETGQDREAVSGWAAIPMPDIGNYRTSRGATKPMLKPSAILGSGWRNKGRIVDGKSYVVRWEADRRSYSGKGRKLTGKNRRRKWTGNGFIYTVGLKKGSLKNNKRTIQGKPNTLQFLYQLKRVTRQTKKISWIGKVSGHVQRNLLPTVRSFLRDYQ